MAQGSEHCPGEKQEGGTRVWGVWEGLGCRPDPLAGSPVPQRKLMLGGHQDPSQSRRQSWILWVQHLSSCTWAPPPSRTLKPVAWEREPSILQFGGHRPEF